ncbi:AAA family ATPase [Chromobacterium sphagni]|uniref:AAA family ATPase n=1 Tax=Chromobacterium sphagni TaxID=1903179 RepID=A0A1S1X5P1_9NEIS|nr:AAA family ATPase [Chromobacterium sphagni]OHX14793.1 hypothetical protein BI347_15735 [Chromobacterium sphagni]OHX16388.1 hypothetical protein BI344_21540 [Chromobacterium sphagni]
MKLVIIGNSGSGKTWLASRLAERHQAALIHLDHLFWQQGGFRAPRPAEEVDGMISAALSQSGWIAEGVFGDLAARFLPQADALIWLDADWTLCRARLQTRLAAQALHMGRPQDEASAKALLSWAENYGVRRGHCSHSGHLALYEGFAGHKRRLASPDQVNALAAAGLQLQG